jgi:hypothetical protein
MSDTTASASALPTPVPPRSLPRPDFVQVLAFLIVAAWIAAIFLHLTIDQTLTNVVMIVVGYFFGSSTGSRAKDSTISTLTAPAPNPGK